MADAKRRVILTRGSSRIVRSEDDPRVQEFINHGYTVDRTITVAPCKHCGMGVELEDPWFHQERYDHEPQT